MKDIKDYLHLYLGCEVEYGYDGRKAIGDIHGLDPHAGWKVFTRKPIPMYHTVRTELLKPILRPLSDMTEEEFDYMFFKQPGYVSIESKALVDKRFDISPHQVAFLLSKGFDLFGLIEAGLAIDRTTLKQTV